MVRADGDSIHRYARVARDMLDAALHHIAERPAKTSHHPAIRTGSALMPWMKLE